MRAVHAFYTCQALEQQGIEKWVYLFIFFLLTMLRVIPVSGWLLEVMSYICLAVALASQTCWQIEDAETSPYMLSRSRFPPRLSNELTNSGDFKSCQWNISGSPLLSAWPALCDHPAQGQRRAEVGRGWKLGLLQGGTGPPVAPGHLDITSPRAVMDAPPFLLTPGWRPIMDTLVSP